MSGHERSRTSALAAHPQVPGDRAIGRLVELIGDVVAHLEGPAQNTNLPLAGAVAECNSVLEHCLEARRESPGRASIAAARDELKRLTRLLTLADHADAPVIMRQIRKVLGRFDR